MWDVDCSDLINVNGNGIAEQGEYFNPVETKTYALMRAILEGNDRSRLIKTRTGWSREITQAIPLILRSKSEATASSFRIVCTLKLSG